MDGKTDGVAMRYINENRLPKMVAQAFDKLRAEFQAEIAQQHAHLFNTPAGPATAQRPPGGANSGPSFGAQPEQRQGQQSGPQPQTTLQTPLKVFTAGELLKYPAPAQEWIVEPWIPRGEVTMLAGDGGGGKSILMLQLGVACDTGSEWLGIKVAPCNALYLSGEDPKDELHRRLERIARQQQVQPESLKRFKLVDLASEEATEFVTPVRVGKDTKLQTTALFATIERLATESSSGLIIIDASADFYGGEESTRREVRAFIRLLRGLAMRLDAAIVLIAHPSVEGMKTGRNYSGSTHWNNGVRSRLAFTKPEKTDDNPEPAPDIRVLELAKSNRTRAGEKIEMRWVEGEFKPAVEAIGGTREAVKAANARMDEAKKVFLELLDAFTAQGRKVNCSGGKTYAPKMMVEHVPHPMGSKTKRCVSGCVTARAGGRLSPVQIAAGGTGRNRRDQPTAVLAAAAW
jgi:RecA-family ATPase